MDLIQRPPDKASWKTLLAQARKGNDAAQAEVAFWYDFGLLGINAEIIVRRNVYAAYSWYEKAAALGNESALTALAYCLSEGKGCELDIPKAIETSLLAIEKGSYIAARNLGCIYRDLGEFSTAFKYYNLANSLNKNSSALTVGLCFYHGVGVPVDRKAAYRCFKSVSADKGGRNCQSDIDEANYLLGRAYLSGDGVRKSLVKARHYLNLANADKDHPSAEQLLFLVGRGD